MQSMVETVVFGGPFKPSAIACLSNDNADKVGHQQNCTQNAKALLTCDICHW